MRVNVKAYGMLSRILSEDGGKVELEVGENVTVEEVLLKLGIDLSQPWNASLNGTLAEPSDVVPEDASILVFPPISGGS
jgi:molybdopterin converting factor small subunit